MVYCLTNERISSTEKQFLYFLNCKHLTRHKINSKMEEKESTSRELRPRNCTRRCKQNSYIQGGSSVHSPLYGNR